MRGSLVDPHEPDHRAYVEWSFWCLSGTNDVEQNTNQRRLAGAVGAKQSKDLAGSDFEGNAFQRYCVALRLVDALERDGFACRRISQVCFPQAAAAGVPAVFAAQYRSCVAAWLPSSSSWPSRACASRTNSLVVPFGVSSPEGEVDTNRLESFDLGR